MEQTDKLSKTKRQYIENQNQYITSHNLYARNYRTDTTACRPDKFNPFKGCPIKSFLGSDAFGAFSIGHPV